MEKIILKIGFLGLISLAMLSASSAVLASPVIGGASVQTNSATNILNNQATLNGYFATPYFSGSSYVWFQYGTDTNYGNNSFQQTLNYPGAFLQQIGNLSTNTIYHFRAVAQNGGTTIYGQDMTFTTSGSNNYYGARYLSAKKQVINVTSGNLIWQNSVAAKPGDILSFAITMQPIGYMDIHNVLVRDILPANLIYKGNLLVNASLNYSVNPSSGINIGTIPANGVSIISYQAQVAGPANFVYGTTILSNSAIITSAEAGTQTSSASVLINNSYVSGATTISTGLTNDPVKDSFFLPILLIVLGSWFYFSGNVYRFSDWINSKI